MKYFFQLERRDVVASQTLRAALTKAEQAHPGLSYDIVMGILKKGDLNINLNESILRLQGNATETDRKYIRTSLIKWRPYVYNVFQFTVVEYRLNRSEDAFQELNKKSASLKRILSRIPDEISDRKTFLETIKYVSFIQF